MANTVTFRRIGGRIVPIRNKESQLSKTAKGVAAIGVGVGLAHVAGVKAYEMLHKSATMENEARTIKATAQLSMLNKGGGAKAARLLRNSGNLFRARNLVLAAGDIVGGALIGAGIAKIASEPNKKKSQKSSKLFMTSTAILGVGVATALTHKYSSFVYRRSIYSGEKVLDAINYAIKRGHKAILMKEL